MENLQWYFEILDMVSGPTRAMQQQLTGLQSELRHLQSSLSTVQQALGHTANGLLDMGAAAQVAQAAWSGLSFIAGTAVSMAMGAGTFLLQSAQFRENTLTGLRLILHGEAAAERAFAQSQRIAQLTPSDTRSVVRQYSGLVMAGFTERQALVLQAAAQDIGAMRGADTMEPFLRAMTRNRSTNTLNGEALQSLTEAVGLPREEIMNRIAQRMHLTAANPRALAQVVAQAVRQNRVTGDIANAAILDVVRERMGGGRLGSAAAASSGTLTGIISNLGSAIEDLADLTPFEHLPGMELFKSALLNVLALLGPTGVAGNRLRHIFSGLVTTVGDFVRPLSGAGGLARMESVFFAIAQAVGLVGHGFSVVWPYLRALGGGLFAGLSAGLTPMLRSLGLVLGAGGSTPNKAMIESFAALGRYIGWGAAKLIEFGVASWAFGVAIVTAFTAAYATVVKFVGNFMQLGSNIAQGLAQGIREGFTNFVNAAFGTGISEMIDVVTGRLRMHSPSRVFAELGQYTMQGFAVGIEDGQPRVARTLESAMTAPGGGRGGAGSSAPSVSVEVHVHCGPNADAEEIGRQVSQQTATSLVNIFEQLGMELGVTQ